jgi:hypothetical protein
MSGIATKALLGEGRGRGAKIRVLTQQPDFLMGQVIKISDSPGNPIPGVGLDVPSQENDGDEHGGSVEVKVKAALDHLE